MKKEKNYVSTSLHHKDNLLLGTDDSSSAAHEGKKDRCITLVGIETITSIQSEMA